MTDPLSGPGQGDMVFGTSRSRLAAAMGRARVPEERRQPQPTFSQSEATLARYRQGVDNPFGSGLDSYEPHTALFDEYTTAYDKVQASKLAESATADGTINVDFRAEQADGQVGMAIQAAMDLAAKRIPYVWGGTSATGVDCSGLIYYAYNAAGIKIPRLRAVEYGQMGYAVSANDARPGDIVYYDNPGTTTDHVGIYLGNGKVVQAPQTGDVVRVTNVGNATSYRRIVEDSQFAEIRTPEGGAYWGYGSTGLTWGNVAVSPAPTTPGWVIRNNRQRQMRTEF